MDIRQIGVMSPGDMGQALAVRLAEAGFGVHTALAGRSERTRALAADAGIHDCGTLDGVIATCDLVISVLSPASALDLAGAVAGSMLRTGRKVVLADLNAISPSHARAAAALVAQAGGRFIDGAILGAPPRGAQRVRIIASGVDASLLEQIRHPAIEVRVLSDRIGDASALKMCNAALTKGLAAVVLELLVAAQRLGVGEALLAELREGRADVLEAQLRSLPSLPPKARRWVPEMQEIAATFADVGLTPALFEGIAGLYAAVADTELGRESPEAARQSARSGEDVIRELAGDIQA
jgi:3-hydroxyisobutyrate dehydrogenase-like beta-hydroxyacid dehydrogenase